MSNITIEPLRLRYTKGRGRVGNGGKGRGSYITRCIKKKRGKEELTKEIEGERYCECGNRLYTDEELAQNICRNCK